MILNTVTIGHRLAAVCLALSALALTGCGGGGDDGAEVNGSVPGGRSEPVFNEGQFRPSSTYANRCTPTEEKFFLRSFFEETYLFRDDTPDLDPYAYGSPLEYFQALRSDQVDFDGRPRDRFQFALPTPTYEDQTESPLLRDYGFLLGFRGEVEPEEITAIFVRDGSPAAAFEDGRPRFVRGTRIDAIDGIRIDGDYDSTEIDRLYETLFQPDGQSRRFDVTYPDGSSRTVDFAAGLLPPAAVERVGVVRSADRNVGYLLINGFDNIYTERQLATAFAALADDDLDDLVIDLRYNGGGLGDFAAQTAFAVAGPRRTAGRTFSRLRFRNGTGGRNPVTGEANRPTPFLDRGIGLSLDPEEMIPSLGLDRVFVLTGENTCSAAEAVINGLRGIGVEVIQIGDTTCGKPYGFYPRDNCGITYFAVQFQLENDIGFGDYQSGFAPQNTPFGGGTRVVGCFVEDDIVTPLGQPDEPLLAAALRYAVDGSCPAVPGEIRAFAAGSARSAFFAPGLPAAMVPPGQRP